MNKNGQKFVEKLAASTPDSFDSQFSIVSEQFGLAAIFSRNELTLLYEAAALAVRCYAALNGLDDTGTDIKPEDEARRHQLELAFLEARDILFASPAWQNLPGSEQEPIARTFLTVLVAEDKLAA